MLVKIFSYLYSNMYYSQGNLLGDRLMQTILVILTCNSSILLRHGGPTGRITYITKKLWVTVHTIILPLFYFNYFLSLYFFPKQGTICNLSIITTFTLELLINTFYWTNFGEVQAPISQVRYITLLS